VTTIMPHLANTTPAAPFEGARRSIYLAAHQSPDPQPSDAVVQAMQWDDAAAPTVHVYVNEALYIELTPAEARTLAAMLNLSAGEIDGRGPTEVPALRAA
jgi:hypothetical protein